MAFGVYVHIPYCVKKCPYCDFNSYGVGESFPEQDYTESVLYELEMHAGILDKARLTSIFFGGGTPSLFEAQNIERIISKIKNNTSPKNDCEISLEINPKTADLEKLRGLREAGVNRVSFGVQSFSERKLKFLGRINSPDDSRSILEDAVKAGFENINVDLMYGTTDETPEEWQSDLEEALRFNSTHISAYCLMIEEATQFGNLFRRGKMTLPAEGELTEFITFTTDTLERSGYKQYEISNYSKPGYECRHNMLYWRGDDYLGVGAGAHSHLKSEGRGWGKRYGNIKNPGLYMKSVRAGDKPLGFTEELEKHEALEDTVLMGLRLNSGLEFKSLRDSYSVAPDEYKIGYLINGGLIEIDGGNVRLTDKGTLLSNAVIEKFLDSLSPA